MLMTLLLVVGHSVVFFKRVVDEIALSFQVAGEHSVKLRNKVLPCKHVLLLSPKLIGSFAELFVSAANHHADVGSPIQPFEPFHRCLQWFTFSFLVVEINMSRALSCPCSNHLPPVRMKVAPFPHDVIKLWTVPFKPWEMHPTHQTDLDIGTA